MTCPDKGDHGYVYYASDLNGLGPRLYRATVVVTCTLGIEDMLTVPSGRDDDFTTLWPTGTRVNSVNVSGSVATVDLTAFPATGQVAETAAVQQLVWTVTANDPSLTAVRVRVDGAVPAADINLSNPVRRGNSLATLSHVWTLGPGNGTPQSSPVTIHVYGTGFEGQVPLKIFQDGVEVASSAVVTRMGGFAEASTTFDLPPGELRGPRLQRQRSEQRPDPLGHQDVHGA